MKAELVVRSEVPPTTWERFCRTHPMGSIALDGYVMGPPQYEPYGPYYNANHHEGVVRLATLSSAQQILNDVRMGLDKPFSRSGTFEAHVFVNDCDQDVCAAWFLLNHIRLTKKPTPELNRFINVAGTLDVTAGAFPYTPDMRILRELSWVFEPYTHFRRSGEMTRKDNAQYAAVIFDVEQRIGQHLEGRGQSTELDTRFELVGGGDGWSMVYEVGADARMGVFLSGIDAFVAIQQASDAHWRYSIGRRSQFIDFPLPEILARLNQEEGCTADAWGGAGTIGGSPRVNGSQLSPDIIERIINDEIAKQTKTS